MMFNLTSILKLLPAVGPVVAALPEFKAVFDQIVETFSSHADQVTLQKAYASLMAENDEGHATLQELIRRSQHGG